MKIVATILIVLALLVQFCLLSALGGELVIPNLTLALLVMLSFYIDVEQMMWLALVAGLFTDMYSKTEFGLFLGLYILVVLVCKVVLNLSSTHRSWWLATVVLVGASVVQGLFAILPLVSAQLTGSLGQLLEQVVWFALLTTVSGLVVYVLLRFATTGLGRYIQARAN